MLYLKELLNQQKNSMVYYSQPQEIPDFSNYVTKEDHQNELLKIENKWKEENQNLREEIAELKAKLNTKNFFKKITKEDLSTTIPKLVHLIQVFGKAYEIILKGNQQKIDFQQLMNIVQEYCKITDQEEADKLCRYIMDNPKNPHNSANKITSTHVVDKINTLIEGNKIYTEEDFNKLMNTIKEHKNEKERSELLTTLTMFSLDSK